MSKLKDGPCIFWVCRKLGFSNSQEGGIYQIQFKEEIERCFGIRGFQGLGSGDGYVSAHYFIACTDHELFYLDPHVLTQNALTS